MATYHPETRSSSDGPSVCRYQSNTVIFSSAADLVQGEHKDHNDTKQARHRKQKGCGPRLQLWVTEGEKERSRQGNKRLSVPWVHHSHALITTAPTLCLPVALVLVVETEPESQRHHQRCRFSRAGAQAKDPHPELGTDGAAHCDRAPARRWRANSSGHAFAAVPRVSGMISSRDAARDHFDRGRRNHAWPGRGGRHVAPGPHACPPGRKRSATPAFLACAPVDHCVQFPRPSVGEAPAPFRAGVAFIRRARRTCSPVACVVVVPDPERINGWRPSKLLAVTFPLTRAQMSMQESRLLCLWSLRSSVFIRAAKLCLEALLLSAVK
jgi:hypothetical protein